MQCGPLPPPRPHRPPTASPRPLPPGPRAAAASGADPEVPRGRKRRRALHMRSAPAPPRPVPPRPALPRAVQEAAHRVMAAASRPCVVRLLSLPVQISGNEGVHRGMDRHRFSLPSQLSPTIPAAIQTHFFPPTDTNNVGRARSGITLLWQFTDPLQKKGYLLQNFYSYISILSKISVCFYFYFFFLPKYDLQAHGCQISLLIIKLLLVPKGLISPNAPSPALLHSGSCSAPTGERRATRAKGDLQRQGPTIRAGLNARANSCHCIGQS